MILSYCDCDTCDTLRLQQRVAVLSTLCGIDTDKHVVVCITRIQRFWRYVAHRKYYDSISKACSIWRLRATTSRNNHAAVIIQRIFRGFRVRDPATRRLLRKYIALKKRKTRRLPAFRKITEQNEKNKFLPYSSSDDDGEISTISLA